MWWHVLTSISSWTTLVPEPLSLQPHDLATLSVFNNRLFQHQGKPLFELDFVVKARFRLEDFLTGDNGIVSCKTMCQWGVPSAAARRLRPRLISTLLPALNCWLKELYLPSTPRGGLADVFEKVPRRGRSHHWPSGASPDNLCCSDVYQAEIARRWVDEVYGSQYRILMHRAYDRLPSSLQAVFPTAYDGLFRRWHLDSARTPPFDTATSLKLDFESFDFLIEALRGKTPVSFYLCSSGQASRSWCLVCGPGHQEDLAHFALDCRLTSNALFAWKEYARSVLRLSDDALSLSHLGILLPPLRYASSDVLLFVAGCWTVRRCVFGVQPRWLDNRVSQYPPVSFWISARLSLSSLLMRWGCPLSSVHSLSTEFTPDRWGTVHISLERIVRRSLDL